MNTRPSYFHTLDLALDHFKALGFRPVAMRTKHPLLFTGSTVDDVKYVEIRQDRPGLVIAEVW